MGFWKPLSDYLRGRTASHIAEGLDHNKDEPDELIIKPLQTTGFRPVSFEQYVGQERAKKVLKSYIEEIKRRQVVFPHLLISGSTGTGKTTLAKIMAQELKKNFIEIIASSMNNGLDVSIFEQLNGGILFFDEVHSLKRLVCERLYPVMEDFRISSEEELVPFTLIGATTEIGEIIKHKRPFYDRFKLKIELEDYLETDIRKIVKQYKDKVFPSDKIDSKTFNTIANNARLSPRVAISLLESTIYLGCNVRKALDNLNIISRGLTDKDLKILEVIARNSGAIGEQAICSYINTTRDNYRYDFEPYLLKNNLLIRTEKGRKITEEGLRVLAYLKRQKRRIYVNV